MEGIEVEHLIADKGYDTNAILDYATAHGMEAQIPSKENRKVQREPDKHLYKMRFLVETDIATLKQWRGIATRCAKRAASFLAFIQLRCILLWAKIS